MTGNQDCDRMEGRAGRVWRWEMPVIQQSFEIYKKIKIYE